MDVWSLPLSKPATWIEQSVWKMWWAKIKTRTRDDGNNGNQNGRKQKDVRNARIVIKKLCSQPAANMKIITNACCIHSYCILPAVSVWVWSAMPHIHYSNLCVTMSHENDAKQRRSRMYVLLCLCFVCECARHEQMFLIMLLFACMCVCWIDEWHSPFDPQMHVRILNAISIDTGNFSLRQRFVSFCNYIIYILAAFWSSVVCENRFRQLWWTRGWQREACYPPQCIPRARLEFSLLYLARTVYSFLSSDK